MTGSKFHHAQMQTLFKQVDVPRKISSCIAAKMTKKQKKRGGQTDRNADSIALQQSRGVNEC